jgi:hypothetical protein
MFNSKSAKNITIYFGQTTITGSSLLTKQYTDPNINIIILAFIILQNILGKLYPKMNFKAAYNSQTSFIKEKALRLLFYSKLVTDINTC